MQRRMLEDPSVCKLQHCEMVGAWNKEIVDVQSIKRKQNCMLSN